MQQVFEFAGNHMVLTGALVVAVIALVFHEIGRLFRAWREVSTLEAVRLLNQDDPLVIDVSNGTDFARAHIRGAVHIPPSQIQSGNQKLSKDKERPLLVYCRSNQVAPQMAGRLTKMGFTKVHVLGGGLTRWINDKQPVVQPGASAGAGKKNKKRKSG